MEATASIINIIQITGTLVEYLRAATQAPSDRRKLLLEANSLLALLTSLKDFLILEDGKENAPWRKSVHQLEAPEGPFAQYQLELERLLNTISPRHRLQKMAQTMLWKLTKEDVNEMLVRIERMKTLISIALEMDHTRLSEAILAQISDISDTTKLIRTDTLKLVNSADDAAFRALLDQICLEDYSSVYRSNITEHTAGIGQHFIESSEFEDWARDGSANKTLLCLGDPGVGKTVMATKAIQALNGSNAGLREAVIFVYCDCTRRRSRLNRRDSSPEARSKGVQTPAHFIASLLRQLVEAHGSPSPYLQDLMSNHERQKTRPKPAELEQAFAEVAQNFDRLYLIVDAMDECDSLEMETFAAHLLSLCAAPCLRLLVTTRRHPQIEQIFEDSARLEMHAHDHDTMQYLQSRARREFPPRVLRDPKAMDKILNALLLSANGIPLIARLHMNALRGVRTPGAMLAAIARLKSDSDVYDETYQAAMERITKQPGELPAMAMRVLRWIVCAKRYIYTRELQCILAMADDSNSLDEDFVPDMDDVFLACEGLVCAVTSPSSETVRLELVHTTARQYFDRKLAEWAPDVSLDLTRTCLNVLSFEDLSPLPASLVAYAWRYWGQHAKDVEELNEDEQFGVLLTIVRAFWASSDPSISPLAQRVRIREQYEYPFDAPEDGTRDFEKSHGRFCGDFHPEHRPRPFSKSLGTTGYHMAAKFGLTRIFESLWDTEDDLNETFSPGKYGKQPLFEAMHAGSLEMVKKMISCGAADPDRRSKLGPNALEAAMDEPQLVELLLETGKADPNGVDFCGKPLVVRAAGGGQKRTLELLLSAASMNPAVRDEYGHILLTLAASNSQLKMDVVHGRIGRRDPLDDLDAAIQKEYGRSQYEVGRELDKRIRAAIAETSSRDAITVDNAQP